MDGELEETDLEILGRACDLVFEYDFIAVVPLWTKKREFIHDFDRSEADY